jgi:hypothetical protein
VSRVRRVRNAPPVQRVRRVRSAATEHTILVFCEVLDGSVSAEDACEWVNEAIRRYSEFRNGWVGLDARGRLRRPVVSIA